MIKEMSHTERIGRIIGEYTYTFDYGDFCKITPTKQLSEKETLELFEYIYNNIAADMPIQVFNTFNDINYFEWRTEKVALEYEK